MKSASIFVVIKFSPSDKLFFYPLFPQPRRCRKQSEAGTAVRQGVFIIKPSAPLALTRAIIIM